MTLIAGAAVFGYVNSQAGLSERSYANSVGSTNNFLAEDFKVAVVYFPSTTQVTFWLYNSGFTNVQMIQVRLFDTAGQVNILYNYTVTGSPNFHFVTNYLYDLKSTLTTKCKTAADSYESPVLTSVNIAIQNALPVTLTIPSISTNCPSFGQAFNGGTTYIVSVGGLYGSVVTYYQAKR